MASGSVVYRSSRAANGNRRARFPARPQLETIQGVKAPIPIK